MRAAPLAEHARQEARSPGGQLGAGHGKLYLDADPDGGTVTVSDA